MLCPGCGERLTDARFGEPGHVQFQTDPPPARPDGLLPRLIVGLLLAQALHHGFRLLRVASLEGGLVTADWWAGVSGTVTSQGLAALSIFAGAVVATAGRRGGFWLGGVLAILHGAVVVAVDLIVGGVAPAKLIGAQAVIVVVGAFSGALASRVWRPFPPPRTQPTVGHPDHTASAKTPLGWGRILGGAALGVAFSLFAPELLGRVVSASGGAFRVGSGSQAELITWELAAFGVLLGGTIAGASSHGGLAQGFLTGFLSAAGLLGFFLAGDGTGMPSHEFLLRQFGAVTVSGVSARDVLIYAGGQTMLLGMIGGWLGGQLFPPASPAASVHLAPPV